MSGTDIGQPQGAGNNASEFVRKLFKMLEDPSHQDVARWGKDGDTFVVVEVRSRIIPLLGALQS